jgi:carbohydrate diacid regulator
MECFVTILTVPAKDLLDVATILEEYTTGSLDFALKLNETQCALIKFVDEESYEYQSSTEYAEFLLRSIQEETGANVNIYIGGTVKSVYDLSISFEQAQSAVLLSNAINAKGNIHSFKEYLLVRILEDMPRYKLSEYLDTLMEINAREIFADEEMINTAEEFLENNLNVSETSRKLYLHRNTLMYRLDKIEKLTGLNLRKFSDAVTFRLITALIKLVK